MEHLLSHNLREECQSYSKSLKVIEEENLYSDKDFIKSKEGIKEKLFLRLRKVLPPEELKRWILKVLFHI